MNKNFSTAIAEVRQIYAELAQRPIERNCMRQTECCHFKLTGRTPYLTKGEALVAAQAFALPVENHFRQILMARARCCKRQPAIASFTTIAHSDVAPISVPRPADRTHVAKSSISFAASKKSMPKLGGSGPRILQNAVTDALEELR